MPNPIPKPLFSQKARLDLKPLSGVKVCGFRYYPEPRISYYTQKILDDRYHVLHQRMQERADARDRNALWLTVIASTMKAKSVVRSRAARRLKVAFRMSLNEQGFSHDGKPLTGNRRGLSGSVELYPLAPAVTAEFQEIKSQTDLMVRNVMKALRLKNPSSQRMMPYKRLEHGPGVGRSQLRASE